MTNILYDKNNRYQYYPKEKIIDYIVSISMAITATAFFSYIGYQSGLNSPESFDVDKNPEYAGLAISSMGSLLNAVLIFMSRLEAVNYCGRATITKFFYKIYAKRKEKKDFLNRFKKSKNMSFQRKFEHILLYNFKNILKSNKILQAEKNGLNIHLYKQIENSPYILKLTVRAWEKNFYNKINLSVERNSKKDKPFYDVALETEKNNECTIQSIKEHQENPMPFKEDLDLILNESEAFIKELLPEGYFIHLNETKNESVVQNELENKTSKKNDLIQDFKNTHHLNEWQKNKINKIEEVLALFKEAKKLDVDLEKEQKIIDQYLLPEAIKIIRLYPLQKNTDEQIASELEKTIDDYIIRVEQTVHKAINNSVNHALQESKINMSVHDYTYENS